MNWKSFFDFSPIDKISLLILVVVIILTFGLNVFLSERRNTPLSIPQNDSLIAVFERLQESLEDKNEATRRIGNKSNAKESKSFSNKNSNNFSGDAPTKSNSDATRYVKQEKFTEPGSISLNETDTAQWKMVPGIGSSFSARIVKYRDKLGGYTSIHQLREVYGVTDEVFDAIVPFIRKDNAGAEHCVKLDINKLEFKEILAHPYINYEQTKAIVNLRKLTGKISSLSQLAMLEEFTSEDILRITPYIQF